VFGTCTCQILGVDWMLRRRTFSRLEIEDLLDPRTSYLDSLTSACFYNNTARLAV